MTVYVIVSDAGVRDALVLLLEQLGRDAVAFDDCDAFLSTVRPGPDDTVLVDLNEDDDANGARIVRWADALENPPRLIAITSRSRDEIAKLLADLRLPILIRMPFNASRLMTWL
ncbi:hypothetical protein [Breoghania sp. JC706]|uniref:hypothetical protein n=1 Tax=Breoghania sp. JC706 TaxID=3117732 RepID=UPI00300B24FB